MTSQVRTLGTDELEACRALLLTAFVPYMARLGRDFSRDGFARLADALAKGQGFGVDVDVRLAAVAITFVDEAGWEIDWLAVAPDVQGRGLASRLLTAVEARARKTRAKALRLQTAAIMEHLLRLYGRHGFVEVRRAPDPRLRDGHPRVFFKKALRPLGQGAVLFDLDGTLVDSERVAAPACVEALTAFGLTVDLETFTRRFTGLTDEAIIGLLADERGLDIDRAAALDHVEALCLERLATQVEALPGAVDLIARLDRPVAVASNSAPARIRLCLDRAGLLGAFEPHLYSASDVGRGKPAPDLFLHAAERLGVEPGACLVVEDSVHGVEAAKAAGMSAVGFTGAYAHDHALALYRAGAAACVHTFADLGVLLDLE